MTPYKLKILNGVLKLKSFADVVLNIFGIKDLGTQTGNVTDGLVDWSIQHLTKTTAQWNASTTVLLIGQLGIEDTGTTTFKLKVGDGVSTWQQLGYISSGGGNDFPENLFLTVVNKTEDNLLASGYKVLKVIDAQGQRLAVDYALADSDANSADTIGVVYENIDNNQEGRIITIGEITGINTTGSLQGETWADGDPLFLSDTIEGGITNVRPTAPNHGVRLGYVVNVNANNGKIYIKIDNGYEIGELHDVYAPSPSNNDGLFWSSGNTRYENKSIATVLGGAPKIGINKVVNSFAVTGTTSNTLLDSIFIPANTFKLGVAKINIRNVWTTTVSTKTTRIYINTSNSLSGATLLATQATGSAGLSVDIGRYLAVKSLSSIQVFDSTLNTPLSENTAALTTAVSNIAFDSAVNNYIIVAIQHNNASDSCINSFINFEI